MFYPKVFDPLEGATHYCLALEVRFRIPNPATASSVRPKKRIEPVFLTPGAQHVGSSIEQGVPAGFSAGRRDRAVPVVVSSVARSLVGVARHVTASRSVYLPKHARGGRNRVGFAGAMT